MDLRASLAVRRLTPGDGAVTYWRLCADQLQGAKAERDRAQPPRSTLNPGATAEAGRALGAASGVEHDWKKGPANLYGSIGKTAANLFASRTLLGFDGEAASNCASAVTDCSSAGQAWAKLVRPGREAKPANVAGPGTPHEEYSIGRKP